MAKFDYNDFNVLRLEIRECQFEGAWIEVGLKAVPARVSARNNTLNESYRSTNTTNIAEDKNMTQARYTELLDQFTEQKKTKRTAESEKVKEITQLQNRNNQLQTDYENAKLTTVQANRKAKEAVDEVDRVQEETVVQQKILDAKTVEV